MKDRKGKLEKKFKKTNLNSALINIDVQTMIKGCLHDKNNGTNGF